MANKQLEEAEKAISTWLKKEKPYLFALDELVTSMQDGVVTVNLRVYKGFVTDIVTIEEKRTKFTKAIDK